MFQHVYKFSMEKLSIDRLNHDHVRETAVKLAILSIEIPPSIDHEKLPEFIATWIYSLKCSEDSKRKYWAAISAYSRWCVRNSLGPDFVACLRGRMKFHPDPVAIPPTIEEIKSILAHIAARAGRAHDPFPHLRFHAMIALDMFTGMRRSEICGLRRQDVSLSPDSAQFRFVGKGRRQRVVPIAEPLRVYLIEYLRTISTDFIFPAYQNRDHPVDASHFSRMWKQYKNDAGFDQKHWRLHDVRHAVGTHMARSGVSPVFIQELLGHKQITTTMRYVHMSQEPLRKALNALF